MATNPAEVSTLGKITLYTETLAKNPRSTVFVSLCDSYRQMGLPEEALAAARRGTEAMPGYAPGHAMLGRLLAEGGDLVHAREAYETALSLDPNNLSALKGLARVCFRQGDRERTRALLEEALRLKPGDDAVRQMLSFFSDKNTAPLRSESSAPPLSAPGDPIATPTLAEIYLRQGLPQRALQVYRDLLQADPGNRDLGRKLEELEERIRFEEAQAQIEIHEETALEEPAEAAPHYSPAVSLGTMQIEALTRWIEAARRRRRNVQ